MHSHLLAARAIVHSMVNQRAVAPVQQSKPMPFEEWPAWAQDLANSRQSEDAGLGDTATHQIGDTASKKFQEWFLKILGKSCGCSNRRRWLNDRFPYPLQPPHSPPAA
jgi:hypothetical protein